ncbi:calcineurin-like phosphoesterase C-terminal domain-containing protein [Pleomorphovibrio marinus]|uniref:calcineurin-like phosphoesterase C-terminal domain-containing protein n=1 Tax=Pleomorphovibrio marinus TaxID=2164132 RepID=UPI000E0A87B7|nr:calcineurin-like phosphoesterase C-terminal domain-containing protein [Pleomorphovibrio marinus]
MVNYVSHDVVEECIGTDAAFGITLDNHDHNRDILLDEKRYATFMGGSFSPPSFYQCNGKWKLWGELKDETGIPHAPKNDGAPYGYSIPRIEGTGYKIQFKAVRRPADYQMNIFLPNDIAAEKLTSMQKGFNLFSGSERSIAEMRTNESADCPLSLVSKPDPYIEWMHGLNEFLDLSLENSRRADGALGGK